MSMKSRISKILTTIALATIAIVPTGEIGNINQAGSIQVNIQVKIHQTVLVVGLTLVSK